MTEFDEEAVGHHHEEETSDEQVNPSSNLSLTLIPSSGNETKEILVETETPSVTKVEPSVLSSSSASFLHFDPVDIQRVQCAIEEAGSNACGIMGIDVWMLNDSDGKLYHFNKGMNWINPIYRAQLADGSTDEQNEEKINILHRLVDTDSPEYYHPIPQPSGVGLAGNYWQHFGDVAGSASYFQDSLVWREVRAFTSDPDQIPYERMFAVEKLFGKCTGVPFNIFGELKGVVVFYARGSAEERIINTAPNSNFMRMASYNIGSALAMSHSRLRITQSRRQLTRRCFQKARLGFAAVNMFRMSVRRKKNIDTDYKINEHRAAGFGKKTCTESIQAGIRNIRHKVKACVSYAKAKANSVKKKSLRPPAIKPPPPANFFMSVWTFIGCFSVLLVLFSFQKVLIQLSDGNLVLILPPFGALMALQFSLPAAPASQPRNSLFGFVISISVVMVNKILLHHLAGLPLWFHASLGTSLAIFSLQKLGLVHPPAGAAAFVFALSRKDIVSDFLHAGAFLLADVVAIGLAVFFNNLSDTRQYPMYWKLNPFS